MKEHLQIQDGLWPEYTEECKEKFTCSQLAGRLSTTTGRPVYLTEHSLWIYALNDKGFAVHPGTPMGLVGDEFDFIGEGAFSVQVLRESMPPAIGSALMDNRAIEVKECNEQTYVLTCRAFGILDKGNWAMMQFTNYGWQKVEKHHG